MPSPHDPRATPGDAHHLPPPSAEEQARSVALADDIRAEINRRGGAIDFSRFMELALYAPSRGYYSGGQQKFGAAGDFITAPELGSLFARCLAQSCRQALAAVGEGDILEAGAGTGALAADLLLALETLDSRPRRYLILELSAELRARQAETLKQKAPHLLGRVHWLDALPDKDFRGVVLGNELLDAMPVERFRVTATGLQQMQVGWENGQFAWRERPADAAIQQRIGLLGLPAGYASEINFRAEAWVRSMAERLAAGVLLLIDYGFPRAEFYHPQRSTGTLMCHYRHRAHADPLIFPGLQDITAHVDFTAIAEAGHTAGLALLGYTSQAAFLLDSGLEKIVATSNPDDVRAHLALTQQIKKLTLPHEMGELYKVIALGRGLPGSLAGFGLQDRRARL
ncbi:MAG: SAM-dependent methyltransferase [Pseudomonadota bacterium]